MSRSRGMPRGEDGKFLSPKDIRKYEVTVWDMLDGDIIEKLWEATERDLRELEERYRDEPGVEIEIEDKFI